MRQTPKRPSRRAIVVLAGVCAALVALVVTGAVVFGQSTERVAAIDGHAVTRDELLFHMRRLAPEVQNEYQLRGDWTATALQRLTTRALDEIWRDKTMLVLAKEHGLVKSVEHSDFLAEAAAENERRAKAIARGETVYGIAKFSPEQYYTHRLTELRTSLTQRLSAEADDPLWVTADDIRRAFDADREAWSANATRYAYTKLVVALPDGAPADYAAGLQRRVAAAGRLADVAAREPGAKLTTATHDGGATTGQSARDQDLVAVLSRLAPGQISAPVTDTHQITYYELDGKTVDEAAAFAEYSRRIRQSLIGKKFDEFLQRRVKDSAIEVDTAAVNAINPEDVQK